MLSHKKICNSATVREYEMPLGSFMHVKTDKKCVKFRVKIPSGCSENGKQLWGYFLPQPVYMRQCSNT